MKTNLYRILFSLFILSLWITPFSIDRARAQGETPSSDRPLVVIKSYYLDSDTIVPGQSFRLYLSIENKGALVAHNLIFSFGGEDFLPQETGGVIALGSLGSGEGRDISQALLATGNLWGRTTGTVAVTLNYNGPAGESYSESFTITLNVLGWSGKQSTATPTPTATTASRAQLVVANSSSDVDPLQPGTVFNLNLEIHNLGSGDAKSVTMILGGGSFGTTGEATPQPGGVSGAGADLSVFAPLGSSNLQFLGDIPVAATYKARQQLIANVSANPGAYALKISFVYSDAHGNRFVDDQIITLLVYQLPQVEVNFYRDPGPISAMMPNTLPIQVTNLGRKSVVMGNMTVTADNAELMNNTSLVGTLDAGGYFPLDVMLIPSASGPLQIQITITYTDDFNQPRAITQTMEINVLEAAPGGGDQGMGPGDGEFPAEPPVMPETFWQKVVRFLKGLVGLDSGAPQPATPPGDVPFEGSPDEGPSPMPVPGGKG